MMKKSPAALFTSTPDGRFMTAGRAAARIFGYQTPEDMTESIAGIGDQLFADPTDWERINRLLEDDGEVLDYECFLVRRDGSRFLACINVLAGNSRAKGYGYHHYSIAETDDLDQAGDNNHCTQGKARHEISFLQKLINAIPNPVFYKDRQGRYLGCNLAFEEFLGRSGNEIVGRTVFDMGPPDIAQKYYDADQQLFQNPGKQQYEWKVRSKGGEIRDVVFYKATFNDDQDSTAGLIGVILDITERKRIEEELQATRMDLSTILDTVPVMIWRKDANGRYLHANRLFCDTVGVDLKDLRGKSDFDVHPEEIARKYSNDDQKVISSAGPLRNISERHRKSTGKTGWSLTEKLPCYDKDGNISGTIGFALDITELKSAEEELRIKSLAIESSINALVMADLEGNMVYVNPAFLSMWGYQDAEEVLGRPAYSFCQSKDEPDLIINNLHSHGFWQGELCARRKDGSFFHVEVTANLVHDSQGSPLCFQAAFIDITERKKAIEELNKRNRELDVIFRSARSVSLIRTDLDGMIMEFSSGSEAIFGYRREEMIGRHVSILHTEEEAEKLPEFVARLLKDEGFTIETILVRRSKEKFPALFSVQPVFDELGRVDSTLGVSFDITKQKNIEQALAESENKYRLLVENLNEGIWQIDQDARTVFVNSRMAEMLGYSVEEMLGKYLFDFTDEQGRQFAEKKIEKRRQGINEQHEAELIHKKGHKVFALLATTPVFGENKTYCGALAAVSDITRRKKAEESLKQANKALEYTLAEKDKLFSIISHDLKSPASGIVGLTRVLAEDYATLSREDIGAFSSAMHKSSEQLMALLNDLLQWSRMSRGIIDYSPEPMDLQTLVNTSLQTAMDVAGQKEILISQDIPSGLRVSADKAMLNTVFRNLIFNAVKFSQRKDSIFISARNIGSAVEVCIRDNGIGMDKETLARVFNHEKTKCQLGTEGEKGTGLGLVLCKEFVEKHGGSIRLESESGKGTAVYFTLPAAS